MILLQIQVHGPLVRGPRSEDQPEPRPGGRRPGSSLFPPHGPSGYLSSSPGLHVSICSKEAVPEPFWLGCIGHRPGYTFLVGVLNFQRTVSVQDGQTSRAGPLPAGGQGWEQESHHPLDSIPCMTLGSLLLSHQCPPPHHSTVGPWPCGSRRSLGMAHGGQQWGAAARRQLREVEVQRLSEERWKVLHTLSPRGIHPPQSAISVDMTITTMGC